MTQRSQHLDSEALNVGRRQMLKGLGLASLGCPFSGALLAEAPTKPPHAARVTDAPVVKAAMPDDKVPFYGKHQAGVTTPPSATAI